MCGIFGWLGKDPKKFNKAKFDIQGLYNDSRGGDSCGITTDGEIYYGIGNRKDYFSFLAESGYETLKEFPYIFGHTRKSSVGLVNSNNAHPFGFGGNKEMFRFIGCHNGTLSNYRDLAKKYGIKDDVHIINDKNNSVFERNKIDSEILFECMYKSQSFDVLSQYIGAAALIFTDTNEPNVVYAFRGASRMDSYDHFNKVVDERPLYYYIENKNSLYISSMPESLIAIGGEIDSNLFEFEENFVYKITDGDISKCEKIAIDRSEAHQRPVTFYPTYNHGGYQSSLNLNLNKKARSKSNNKKPAKVEILNDNIYNESESRCYKSPISFNKLRYNRNGHRCNGIYTWIPEYGFYLLTLDYKDAVKASKKLLGIPFVLSDGMFVFSEKGQTELNYADQDVIFPFDGVKNTKIPLLYIHDGILLQYEADYIAIVEKFKKFSFEDLSRMSKHPIIDVSYNSRLDMNQCITKDGELFTGKISPVGTKKIYEINNGNLEFITTSDEFENNEEKERLGSILDEALNSVNKNSLPIKFPFTSNCLITEQSDESFIEIEIAKQIASGFNNSKMQKTIEDFIAIEDDLFKDVDEDKALEEDKLEVEAKNQINIIMLPVYLDLQEAEKKLRIFKDSESVKEVLELNNDYLMSLDELIDKTYN